MSDKACTLERKSPRLTLINEKIEKEKSIRRSTRDPSLAMLDRTDVKILLQRIKRNHKSSVVLKIKDNMMSDINSVIFDAILEALWKNTVCQVKETWCRLYVFIE
jgi:hypothetical protein